MRSLWGSGYCSLPDCLCTHHVVFRAELLKSPLYVINNSATTVRLSCMHRRGGSTVRSLKKTCCAHTAGQNDNKGTAVYRPTCHCIWIEIQYNMQSWIKYLRLCVIQGSFVTHFYPEICGMGAKMSSTQGFFLFVWFFLLLLRCSNSRDARADFLY